MQHEHQSCSCSNSCRKFTDTLPGLHMAKLTPTNPRVWAALHSYFYPHGSLEEILRDVFVPVTLVHSQRVSKVLVDVHLGKVLLD